MDTRNAGYGKDSAYHMLGQLPQNPHSDNQVQKGGEVPEDVREVGTWRFIRTWEPNLLPQWAPLFDTGVRMDGWRSVSMDVRCSDVFPRLCKRIPLLSSN